MAIPLKGSAACAGSRPFGLLPARGPSPNRGLQSFHRYLRGLTVISAPDLDSPWSPVAVASSERAEMHERTRAHAKLSAALKTRRLIRTRQALHAGLADARPSPRRSTMPAQLVPLGLEAYRCRENAHMFRAHKFKATGLNLKVPFQEFKAPGYGPMFPMCRLSKTGCEQSRFTATEPSTTTSQPLLEASRPPPRQAPHPPSGTPPWVLRQGGHS